MAAGNENFNIPIGIDAGGLYRELSEINNALDKMEQKAVTGQKDMQSAITTTATAGERLSETLTGTTQRLTTVATEAKKMGKELGDALSGKGLGAGLDAKVDAVRKKLSAAATSAIKVDVSFDERKLDILAQQIRGAASAAEEFNVILDFSKSQLAQLEPGSQAYTQLSQQIQTAEQFINELSQSEENLETQTTSLRSQLRAMREELSRMELAGEGDTAEFHRLAQAAGELQDQMGDTQQRIRAFASDTRYLDAGISAVTGLTGAFTAAQGAVALFGDENKKTQEIIQKVTGAMAILQGIQALANTLNKDSAFSVILLSRARAADTVAATAETVAIEAETVATQEATVATTAFTAALLLNPVVLVTVAIVAAVAAIVLYASGNDEAAEAVDRLNQSLESNKALLDDQVKNLERGANLSTAYAKLRGAKESELTEITTTNLKKQVLAREQYAKTIEDNFAILEKKYNDGIIEEEDYTKEVEKLGKERADNNQQLYDLDNKIQVAGIDAQTQHNKELKEQRKKELEDRKKHADELKKINDQILKFTKELNTANVAAMADGADKEKAQARLAAKDRIDALNAEQALSVRAANIRKQAIAAINKELHNQIEKIDKDAAQKRLELQLGANATLAGLERDGTLKELDVQKAEYEQRKHEIEVQYKDEAALRVALLNALAASNAAAVKRITEEGAQKGRDAQEESEILTIELMSKYAVKNKGVEEQKQIEILKVQLKYAKLSLDAIQDDGTAETALRKKQAQFAVKSLQDALDKATTAQGTKGLDWFKVLGLGDLTDEQQQAVAEAAQKSLDSISTITDFIVSQYQRQIDKKQELIDEYDRQIDDLEESLDREKELQANGLANNVALIEKELAAKKKQKEDEQKQVEELRKKQAAAQKAQMALDTVTQTVNLITSATEIFKSLAGIPFIGVPLAIATIGLMTGAFIAAKAKAFAAVGDGGSQKFKMGGWIKGRSHGEGGHKYISADGSGNVKELEDGEHVTNATQAAKYGTLLDAINDGGIEAMSEDTLRDMLAGMGISLSSDFHKNAVLEIAGLDSARANTYSSPGSNDLATIREDVAYLANDKRNGSQRWEDDKYSYEKRGNKTTKIKK